MSKVVLYIKADTNDADYVTSENKIQDGDLETIRKVCTLLKTEKPKGYYNWPSGDQGTPRDAWNEDQLTDEEIDVFNDYTPYGEYGIHSIEQVQIRRIEVLEDLF